MNYKEVARETHSLHYVQFELNSVDLFFGKFFAIALMCAFPSQFCKVVGFEFNSVQLFVTANFLDFFLCFFPRHYNVAVFVLGKFVEKVFVSEFLAVFFLCTKVFWNRECRHNRSRVDVVNLNFVGDFHCVFQCFGQVGEDGFHFFWRLKPFLLGVCHSSVGCVQFGLRAEADESLVGFAVFFLYKMDIVCSNNLDVVLAGKFHQHLVYDTLFLVGVACTARLVGLVPLKFDIEVVAEHTLEPKYRFFGLVELVGNYQLWYFSTEAGGTCDYSLVVFLEDFLVDSCRAIVAVNKCNRRKLAEVLVALFVLRQ